MLAGVMVFGAWRLGSTGVQLLREREATKEFAELERLEHYLLPAKFDAWLARGNDGLQWTAMALTSRHPAISLAAEHALLHEADSWKLRPQSETAGRIVTLARALSSVADRLPAARRPAVRRLVERLATWPVDDANAARDLTSLCEAIVSRLPPATEEEQLLAERERAAQERVARVIAPEIPVAEEPVVPDAIRAPVQLQPPADLPLPVKDPYESPPKNTPRRFFAPRAKEVPSITAASPEEAKPLPAEPLREARNVNEWVRELTDLEVMRLLHHGDYGVRYVAEKDLARRGYLREHLPLAKLLVHPDPRERRKLAEQLPRLANIDPRPWLLQLAEDDDLEVRRTAAGILQAARPGLESR
jgi:hypothetical protein